MIEKKKFNAEEKHLFYNLIQRGMSQNKAFQHILELRAWNKANKPQQKAPKPFKQGFEEMTRGSK